MCVQLLAALRLQEEILEKLILVHFGPKGGDVLIGHLNLLHAQVLLHQQNVLRVEGRLEVLLKYDKE